MLKFGMFNWSTDEDKFRKTAPGEFQQWKILQLINYGLDGEKLDTKLLKKNWSKIKDKIINDDIRDYLEYVLWPKSQS